ncbi:MAG TPA: Gfo/Idh/MocA family oxidoreductase [Phycisphaeraceae bacterium]
MSSKRHRVLIVGVGSIGERHLRCFLSTQRTHVSLCEVNESLRDRVAQRYGIAQTYADIDQVPPDACDAAVICAPAPMHVPLATQLAGRRVHLLIEKPLSTTLDGLEDLKQLIQQKGLVAAVAYNLRAHPVLADVKRVLDEGRFGRPLQIVCVSGQHFPTYRPAYRQIYYKDRKTGGGAIQDALTHMLNAGEWLVGPIDRLLADAAHLKLEGVTVEDTVHLIARHGSVMGSYSLNQHQAPNEAVITIVCERGTCRAELAPNPRWCWASEPGGPWQPGGAFTFERDTLYIDQAHAFLDAIEGKGQPLCTLAQGEQTLRVNLAALRSADDTDKFLKI